MGLKCIHPNSEKYPDPLTKNFWVLSESSGKAPCFFAPPVSSSAFKVSHCSVVSTLSAKKTCHPKKNLKHPRGLKTNVSAEGLPSDLVEDSKFVPLNADDPTYGPPALLLLGFGVEEAEKIIYCAEGMIPRSLWDAVNTGQPNLEEVKDKAH
ncbi:hypothetical protein PTKIN_Ptkin16aG0102900 [Pterospermum kingtungense]